MRKYYQAALVIVAFVSFVALVFYRHEYNRLRYVLEVFNYFGRPDNNVENHMSNGLLPKALDNPASRGAISLGYYDNHEGFNEPIPSWQRLNDEIYVYSAYHIDNENKIIAVGLVNHIKRPSMTSCGIFYENDVESTPGIFTYRIIGSEQSVKRNESNDREAHYLGYHLICKYAIKNNKRVIASVKFVAKSQNERKYSSIVVPVKEFTNAANERKSDKEYTGICVAPTLNARPITSTDMINFVAFHISLGIDHLIVYNFGIAPRFNNVFKQIINAHDITIVRLTNITYTTIPWNFPFTQQVSYDVVRSIIQADCLFRTYKKVQIVATLTWDEYLMLKYHRTIHKLFRDIDETESLAADRYRISARNFCVDITEKNETNDTLPRIFGNDKVFDDKRSVYIYRIRMANERSVLINDNIKTREISADVIITNRYEDHCDHNKELEVIPLDDRYVGKFSKSTLKSALSQLFFQHVY